MHLQSPFFPTHTRPTLISLDPSSSKRCRQRCLKQWTQEPFGWIPFCCTSTHALYTQVKLHQKYVKARLACQGVRPTSFDKFRGLGLKINSTMSHLIYFLILSPFSSPFFLLERLGVSLLLLQSPFSLLSYFQSFFLSPFSSISPFFLSLSQFPFLLLDFSSIDAWYSITVSVWTYL